LWSERVRKKKKKKKKKKMEGGGKIEKEKKKCQLDSPPLSLSLSHHPLLLCIVDSFFEGTERERERENIHHQRDVLQEDGYSS
jgi:hypothetical protein